MPSIKELLNQTVNKANKMFAKSAKLTNLQKSIDREDKREVASHSSITIGDTSPDDET